MKRFEMAGDSVVQCPQVHVEIGIAWSKNTTMLARVEADDFDRLLHEQKLRFGLFMQFRVVFSRVLIAQDVKRGHCDMAMGQEWKRVVNVDAAFDGEGQQM